MYDCEFGKIANAEKSVSVVANPDLYIAVVTRMSQVDVYKLELFENLSSRKINVIVATYDKIADI